MSGGGGSTKTTTTRELSPQQQELLDLVIPAAKDISLNPPELFPGSAIAPFNPLQEQAQQAALTAASGPVTQLGQSAQIGTQTLQGAGLPIGTAGAAGLAGAGVGLANPAAQFLLDPQVLSPEFNPFTADRAEAAIRPLEQSLLQNILPQIRGGAIGAGQFGGSRQGIAEGLALQEFTRQAGDISTNIFDSAFQQQLAAMVQALGTTQGAAAAGSGALLEQGARSLFATPGIADLTLAPAQITGGVGFQQQQLEQAQLSEEAQRFVNEQIIPFLVAQDVAQLAFGVPGGSITSTSSGGGGGFNIGQLLGALVGGGAGLFLGGPAGGLAGASFGGQLGGAFG